MGEYLRGTIFLDDSVLTGAELDAEFERIQEVINGNLDSDNFQDGVLPQTVLIDASAEQFDETGSDTNATRVSNAIQHALTVDAPSKVVWVPQTMWGYVEDADYSVTIFDTDVLVVREGCVSAAHDPVAYGAKPGDGAVDDHPAFQAAQTQAQAAAFGANPGMAAIHVTVPGEYTMDTGISFKNVALLNYEGVTYAGTALGSVSWEPMFDHSPLRVLRGEIILSAVGSGGGTDTGFIIFPAPSHDPEKEVVVAVRARCRQAGGAFQEVWTWGIGTEAFAEAAVADLFGRCSGLAQGTVDNIIATVEAKNDTAGAEDIEVQVEIVMQKLALPIETT